MKPKVALSVATVLFILPFFLCVDGTQASNLYRISGNDYSCPGLPTASLTKDHFKAGEELFIVSPVYTDSICISKNGNATTTVSYFLQRGLIEPSNKESFVTSADQDAAASDGSLAPVAFTSLWHSRKSGTISLGLWTPIVSPTAGSPFDTSRYEYIYRIVSVASTSVPFAVGPWHTIPVKVGPAYGDIALYQGTSTTTSFIDPKTGDTLSSYLSADAHLDSIPSGIIASHTIYDVAHNVASSTLADLGVGSYFEQITLHGPLHMNGGYVDPDYSYGRIRLYFSVSSTTVR
jgi:hypothetical protein